MQKKSKDMEGVQARPELERTRPQAQIGTERPAGSAGPTRPMASRGAKSLMKTSELATKGTVPRHAAAGPQPPAAPVPARFGTPAPENKLGKSRLGQSKLGKSRAPAISTGRQQKIEERIAAATEELASGITEAASAAEELRRTMEQIASRRRGGRQRLATDPRRCQQHRLSPPSGSATGGVRLVAAARNCRSLLTETAGQIGSWASNIKHNGERQAARSPSPSS